MREDFLGIAFGSINTGLPKDIVAQLIAAEKIPVTKMEVRKGKIAEKKGLVQELINIAEKTRGILSENLNAKALREFTLEYNQDIIDIQLDKNNAQPGSYQFEVIQLARKSSAMSSGFESPDDSYIGVGFIQYDLPNGETRDIYIDSENSSLRQVANLINRDTESGMRASVVNDGTDEDAPWRLILSLPTTGDGNIADFPHFYFIDGENDFYLEQEREAQDAIIKLDGFQIEVPSNKISDLIPGLTIDLKKSSPGEEFAIKIDEDGRAITEKIGNLISNLNEMLKFIHDQNNMDANTDSSRTLGGDVILQTIQSRLQTTIFKDIMTEQGKKRLGDLGIKFNRKGFLEMDTDLFTSTATKDYKLTSQILSGHFNDDNEKIPGFLNNLNVTLDRFLKYPSGILLSRKKTLQTNIKQIDKRINQRQKMIETKEKNLKNKFARLEGTISRIKAQSAGLAGLGGGGISNPVQQLG